MDFANFRGQVQAAHTSYKHLRCVQAVIPLWRQWVSELSQQPQLLLSPIGLPLTQTQSGTSCQWISGELHLCCLQQLIGWPATQAPRLETFQYLKICPQEARCVTIKIVTHRCPKADILSELISWLNLPRCRRLWSSDRNFSWLQSPAARSAGTRRSVTGPGLACWTACWETATRVWLTLCVCGS